MAHEFCYRRRIEFAETDMAGIVHFANYFRYMEAAEHEFFRSLGLSVHAQIDGRTVSWPRIRAECSFQAPLAFEDELEIHVLVREKTSKTITYDFQFSARGGKPVARGSMTTICVAIDGSTGEMTAVSIPPSIAEKIETAPKELSED